MRARGVWLARRESLGNDSENVGFSCQHCLAFHAGFIAVAASASAEWNRAAHYTGIDAHARDIGGGTTCD